VFDLDRVMFSDSQYELSGDKDGERCVVMAGNSRPCRSVVATMDTTRASSGSDMSLVPGKGSSITTFAVFIF